MLTLYDLPYSFENQLLLLGTVFHIGGHILCFFSPFSRSVLTVWKVRTPNYINRASLLCSVRGNVKEIRKICTSNAGPTIRSELHI